MPRKPAKVPSYCRHKHSGQAVVRIGGRDHYLGEYGHERQIYLGPQRKPFFAPG